MARLKLGHYPTIRLLQVPRQQDNRLPRVLPQITPATAIQKPEIEAANALALHYLSEAVRVVGTDAVPPEVRNAESLLAWGQTQEGRFIHSSAALQCGPNRILSQSTFRAAIAELERTGWAERKEGGMELDGARRRHVWKIREATHEPLR